MKIHSIEHNVDMTKYDSTTFLVKAGSWIVVDFEDAVCRSQIRFDYTKDSIVDGYSLPSFAKLFLKTHYDNINDNIAFLVHDILCNYGGYTDAPFDFEGTSDMFYAILEFYKTGYRWQRRALYRGVSSKVGEKYYNDINEWDLVNYKRISWEWINV